MTTERLTYLETAGSSQNTYFWRSPCSACANLEVIPSQKKCWRRAGQTFTVRYISRARCCWRLQCSDSIWTSPELLGRFQEKPFFVLYVCNTKNAFFYKKRTPILFFAGQQPFELQICGAYIVVFALVLTFSILKLNGTSKAHSFVQNARCHVHCIAIICTIFFCFICMNFQCRVSCSARNVFVMSISII